MKQLYALLFVCLLNSCANIVPPTGGEKDSLAPDLLSIYPENFTTQFKNNQIYFSFDENIDFNNWKENFYTSPPVKEPFKTEIKKRNLILTIPDSLDEKTTYCINLDNCIKDVNEGNVLSDLKYLFSTSNEIDTLTINGEILDAYSLAPENKIWVLLYDISISDSLVFNSQPKYVARTNIDGKFCFPNLPNKKYRIYAISGDNFQLNDVNKKVGFYKKNVIGGGVENITLYLFNSKSDTVLEDSLLSISTIENIDALTNTDIITSNLTLILGEKLPIIVSLLKENNLVIKQYFQDSIIKIEKIPPGEYDIKFVIDENHNKIWDTGNLYLKILPEKVLHYPEKILIRSNWDLELNWEINSLK